MFSSTHIHPQQESRGGPSVNPSRHPSLRHRWFPNQECFISVYIFSFLFFLVHRVLIAVQASIELQPGASHHPAVCWRLLASITGSGPSGFSVCSLQALDTGSDPQAQWLCTSGIFPDQGVNQRALHCKAGSYAQGTREALEIFRFGFSHSLL